MIEGIMDFVFNNLFIVIIAIAIISNLVSSSKKSQRRNEQRESQQSQSSGSPESGERETLESKIERNLKKFENIFEEEKEVVEDKTQESKPIGKVMTSIEEQQKEQREALANRFRTNVETDDSNKTDTISAPKIVRHHTKRSRVNKQSLKRRLNNKGLQESVVMAEVLGKPRALKPYKSKMNIRD